MISPQISQYYRQKLEKTGIALTLSQLLQHLKKLKIKYDKKDVAKWLSSEKLSGRFSRVVKPKLFQTVGILRPGVYFMDYAEFHKPWGWHNKGATGFMLAVENVTNKLFVHPCKTKETASWENAIEKFVTLTRNVTTIFSDRDTVVTSKNFQNRLMAKHKVRWYFLKKGSKSYLAERYIGFIKTKLSQALLSRSSPTKNWTQFVDPIVSEYNKQKIEGTAYSRQSIDVSNFNHFLQQKFKTQDPEASFSGFKIGPFVNAKWNAAIFKFGLGQKVLLSRPANWKEGDKHHFTKHSVVGGFGPNIYTISGRQLRQSAAKNRTVFVAVYGLSELGPNLHFYESELKAVTE